MAGVTAATAAAVGVGVSAVGSIASSAIASGAASDAADAQSAANQRAMALAQKYGDKAAAFSQKATDQFAQYPAMYAPYQSYGAAGRKMMGELTGIQELINPPPPEPSPIPAQPTQDQNQDSPWAKDMTDEQRARFRPWLR